MSSPNPLGPTETEVTDFVRVLHDFLLLHTKQEAGRPPVRVRLDLLVELALAGLLRKLLETEAGGSLIVLMDRAFALDAATRVFLSLSDSDYEKWANTRVIGDAALVRIMEALLRLEPWRGDTVPTNLRLATGGAA